MSVRERQSSRGKQIVTKYVQRYFIKKQMRQAVMLRLPGITAEMLFNLRVFVFAAAAHEG